MEDRKGLDNQSASALYRELVSASPLRSVQTAVEANAEDVLMGHLVSLQEAQTGGRADAIRKTMSLLEGAMERDPVMAARLMCSLYPLAGEALLHEVCDAIDIWIYEYHPRELAEVFRKKAQNTSTGYMRTKYMEWATIVGEVHPKQ